MSLIFKKLQTFWKSQDWHFSQQTGLLAVSGGRDSMLLAQLFLATEFQFSVAHVNFKLRGKDSDEDAEFVKNWCETHQVKFHLKQIDLSLESESNTQLSARNTRYAWFDQLMADHGYDYMATAHHLSDSIETIMMNLGRGTGLKGLTGIPWERDYIIRPMSCLKPNEIDELVEKHKLKWREDSSNASDKYLRNKIRHDLIPIFESIFPNFHDSQIKNIQNIKADLNLLNHFIEDYKKKYFQKKADLHYANINELAEHPERTNLLYHLLQNWEINADQVSQIWNAFESQEGKIFHGKNGTAYLSDGVLILEDEPFVQPETIFIDEGKNSEAILAGKLTFEVVNPPASFPNDPNVAYFDYDKITWPLMIRHWETGDKFQPLGLQGKHQKLHDFFSNNKYAIPEKKRQALMCSDSNIAWIIGKRVAHTFAISDQTKRCLKVGFVPNTQD